MLLNVTHATVTVRYPADPQQTYNTLTATPGGRGRGESEWLETEMKTFKLRFSAALIRSLSEEYQQDLGKRDRELEDEIEKQVFPSYCEKRYLTKDEFLKVCKWKTLRSQWRCKKNKPEFIEEISKIVLKTHSERLQIEILNTLARCCLADSIGVSALRFRGSVSDSRFSGSMVTEHRRTTGLRF